MLHGLVDERVLLSQVEAPPRREGVLLGQVQLFSLRPIRQLRKGAVGDLDVGVVDRPPGHREPHVGSALEVELALPRVRIPKQDPVGYGHADLIWNCRRQVTPELEAKVETSIMEKPRSRGLA